MLNTTNQQGNANQNHNDMSVHTSQNGYHEKKTTATTTNNMLSRMWRKWNPHALLVEMEIGTATMENTTEVPQ